MSLILILAYALLIIGQLMVLIAAFREGVLWGLACLFIPVVTLFFLIVHWHEAKKGFFIQLFGVLLMIVAFVLSPQLLHSFH